MYAQRSLRGGERVVRVNARARSISLSFLTRIMTNCTLTSSETLKPPCRDGRPGSKLAPALTSRVACANIRDKLSETVNLEKQHPPACEPACPHINPSDLHTACATSISAPGPCCSIHGSKLLRWAYTALVSTPMSASTRHDA
jgi:hypothetical protein